MVTVTCLDLRPYRLKYTHTHTHTHTCTQVHTHAHTHTCTQVHTHACMYVCNCTYVRTYHRVDGVREAPHEDEMVGEEQFGG